MFVVWANERRSLDENGAKTKRQGTVFFFLLLLLLLSLFSTGFARIFTDFCSFSPNNAPGRQVRMLASPRSVSNMFLPYL